MMKKCMMSIALLLTIGTTKSMEQNPTPKASSTQKKRLEKEIQTLLFAHKFLKENDTQIGCNKQSDKKRIRPIVKDKIKAYVTILETELKEKA